MQHLQRAFPRQVMNAYDWYLMLGALRHGDQIEVPEVLLFRERTDWKSYSRIVDRIYPPGWRRKYPVLHMSLAAFGAGFVPPKPQVLKSLLVLNRAKRDEYQLVCHSEEYFLSVLEKTRL